MNDKDAKIRNVGPKSAAWLRQVGVRTAEDLFRIGPVAAFLKVKRAVSGPASTCSIRWPAQSMIATGPTSQPSARPPC